MTNEEILAHIRDVKDFPKPGILFKDITTAIKEPEVFKSIIDNMYDMIKSLKIDSIVAIESRGYIFGAPLAYKLGAGLQIIRKPGKLPAEVDRITYNLEYGSDSLEIHKGSIAPNSKVLIIDDVLATGGTVTATIELLKKSKAEIVGCAFLMELTAISNPNNLGIPVFSLIKC